MESVYILKEIATFAPNILPYSATFDNAVNIAKTSGVSGASATYQRKFKYDGENSILAFNQSTSTALNFNLGSTLSTTIVNTGIYVISLRLLHENKGTIYTDKITIKITVNGVPSFYTMDCQFTTNMAAEKWHTFAQSFSFATDDIVNFSFESVCANASSSGVYIDGFKMELSDRNNGLPTIYTKPTDDLTGWQSRVDITNTQSLTANTDNTIAFSGTLESNGGLILLDSNSKITPLKVGDFIVVDFAFTAVTPSGSSNHLHINFVVNGVNYRSENHTFLKGSGVDDNVSVSYGFPVSADFLANGGVFKINPSTAVTIKNRYISVCRTHKGI
jgi:hypothetical protein